jgi:hypothetical protein
MKHISHVIYDVITGQDIVFYKGELVKRCKELNLDNTCISRLKKGVYDAMQHRYCLSERKDEIILTLKDFETGDEFECVDNKTIFLHLKMPYSENDSKYFYELKSKRQNVATICDRLFFIKEYGVPKNIIGRTKKESLKSMKNLREHNSANNKIRSGLRSKINLLIKKGHSYKFDSFNNLIGCSKIKFKEHLEKLFYDNITWDNYGKLWHVDHIMPCFMFDLLNEDEVRKCFHYTNLRPLLAHENLSRPRNRAYYLDSYIELINKTL